MGKVPHALLKRFREELVEFGHRECFSERALAKSHHRQHSETRVIKHRRDRNDPMVQITSP